MKPENKWIDDWNIGIVPSREHDISVKLLNYFENFWNDQNLENKSKSTRNRYSSALHALGGYLVEQAISAGSINKTADELLSDCVGSDEGPLIHQDNEDWQDELDMVCRKFYKFISRNANKIGAPNRDDRGGKP